MTHDVVEYRDTTIGWKKLSVAMRAETENV